MDKGVWALAIIRTAESIHRMSPCGTKQTKWPCSGSPSIPFSFYEAPVTSSLFILPPFQPVSPLFTYEKVLPWQGRGESRDFRKCTRLSFPIYLSVSSLCEKAESARHSSSSSARYTFSPFYISRYRMDILSSREVLPHFRIQNVNRNIRIGEEKRLTDYMERCLFDARNSVISMENSSAVRDVFNRNEFPKVVRKVEKENSYRSSTLFL